MTVWVLEDEARRTAAMREAVETLRLDARFFRSAGEIVAAVDAGDDLPTVISLDHDLVTASGIDLGSGTGASEALGSV